MTDSEGLLPSRPQPAADDRGSLPAIPATPAPAAAAPAPAVIAVEAPGPVAREVGAPENFAATQSLEERLAAVTAAGGLTVLPADFGDAQGDWIAVRSENPFTVLYLDHRQAGRITAEIVVRHRELLQRFWQEKLRSMSQGAARYAILKKYGGQEESERLVRSYPEAIERAYERLATRGGIDATSRQIQAEAESIVFGRIDEKLGDFLVDLVLQPDEVRALLDFGERSGVARNAVAERVHQRLRAKGFVADTEARGRTLEAQLLSTTWAHPSRREPQATAAVVPRKNTLLVPLFFFSFVVVLVLLIAAALRTSRPVVSTATRSVDLSTSATHVEPSVQTVTTQTVSASPPAISAPEPVQQPRPATATQEETRPPAADISAEERRRVRGELLAIRPFLDSDPQAGLDRIAVLEQSLGAEFGEARFEAAQLRSELEKALLRQQLAAEDARHKREAEERDLAEREREWQQRVAAVEELMKQPNYSGAKTLADQFLAAPDIPLPAAERIRELRGQAVAELQKIFAGAKVKSKTGRSPRGQK